MINEFDHKSFKVISNHIKKTRKLKIIEQTSQVFDSQCLGHFVLHRPEYRLSLGKYAIYMITDHQESSDERKVTATLSHEYGHYFMRTQIYPRFFSLGKYFLRKCELDRVPGKSLDTQSYSVRFCVVVEEFCAWIVGWSLLLKLRLLCAKHIIHGLNCFSTYLYLIGYK